MTLEELKQLSIDYPEDWPARVMPAELQDEHAFQVLSEYHAALDRLEYLLQSIPEPAPKPRPPHTCPEGKCSCITYDTIFFREPKKTLHSDCGGRGCHGCHNSGTIYSYDAAYFGNVSVKPNALTKRELELAREAMGG